MQDFFRALSSSLEGRSPVVGEFGMLFIADIAHKVLAWDRSADLVFDGIRE